ncbi:MAG: bifunctional acetate--CoA ligase family protein/GNAT family N-acetyltransferase [Rhodocyclaceae bacterium]|nr:bifunctional acetate--CoA ligase family protein/GNAT family N-acetyltransferase [Rhodocyclaceae bacterium]
MQDHPDGDSPPERPATGRHYLSPLFEPRSVAVVGASDRPDAVGGIVLRNMLASGFGGALYPVNARHDSVQGRRAWPSVGAIGAPVDLAVVATPAETVPDILEDCGLHGVPAAVVITAGFGEAGAAGVALERRVLEVARRYGIRLVGPNCLGVMRPGIGLDATFYGGGAEGRPGARCGHIAFVSQSGALCTAILDWAQGNDVGFSSVVSMGSSTDVDFGEILDYLALDPETRSILLYIEGIRHARSFMSALRAAARVKPVLLVKVGRHDAGRRAAVAHTASLVGADDVFDAAVSRAGVVRVQTVSQLFTAAKALACGFHPVGERLAIVTNGGGPGVMASDRAADLGVPLAQLSPATLERLDGVLPPNWSHGNPVDLIGDAPAERYRHAVQACLQDDGVDGVLAILTPQAMTRPLEAAREVIALADASSKPLLTCWMGEAQVAEARAAFEAAHRPHFRTPEPAVEVFAHLSAYYRNQQLLMQVPGPLCGHAETPDAETARIIVDNALQARRSVLTEMESKALLAAFRIPVARTMIARSPNEALLIAEQLGFPVAMKVNAEGITHKTDAGGVFLNLGTASEVRSAYQRIVDNIRRNRPGAVMDGVCVESMVVKPNGRELLIGVTSDPVFGPVITFGAGGTTVEVQADRAVALPPLNAVLAREMIGRTRVSRMLGPFRNLPAADADALEAVLLRVSEMVCEIPALREMDINPLILDEHGAVAADARVVVEYRHTGPDRYAHMAIHPYPAHLVSRWQMPDGTDIVIRPIRPEDAGLVRDFVAGLSEEARFFRFMNVLQELSGAQLVRLTQLDYSKEIALLAVTASAPETELGVARFAVNPDGESCEFAIVLADRATGKGLGQKLLSALIDVARSRGLRRIGGEVLATNHAMLGLAQTLGFEIEPLAGSPDVVAIGLPL